MSKTQNFFIYFNLPVLNWIYTYWNLPGSAGTGQISVCVPLIFQQNPNGRSDVLGRRKTNIRSAAAACIYDHCTLTRVFSGIDAGICEFCLILPAGSRKKKMAFNSKVV